MTRRARPRRACFLEQARDDIARLQKDDERLAGLALGTIRRLERGETQGVPLDERAVTGDLGDCRKIYFGLGDPPSHRIVYRDVSDGTVEIIEIVAIERREEMYVYLLTAVRLGRLPIESKPRFNRVHQRVIATRSRRSR